MDTRRNWIPTVRLAMVVSAVAVLVAVTTSMIGDVPSAVIVLPVIVVAFTISWIQSGRPPREIDVPIRVPGRNSASHAA